MTGPTPEKPIASFVLSLVAGVLILVGSGAMAGYSGQGSQYGEMMGGYYGTMSGYYGMMNGYYGFMGGYGSGWFFAQSAIGVVSGIIVILGAIMLYSGAGRLTTWGTLIIVFSAVSLLGMGGYFIGATLGVVGGILAITWKRDAVRP